MPTVTYWVRFAALYVAVYIAPVLLVFVGVIPFAWRFWLLGVMTLVVAGMCVIGKRSAYSLGIRADNIKPSLNSNGILSVVLLVTMYCVLHFAVLHPTYHNHESIAFYVFYVAISSPCQEFLYRSVLFEEMGRIGITSNLVRIVLSALTFAFLHIIYHDFLTVAIAFGIGILWGIIYARSPNLFGVSIAHAVLGAVTIAAGLI